MKKALKRSLSFILAITLIFSSAYVGLSEVDFEGLFAVRAEAALSDLIVDTEYSVASGTTKIFIPEVTGYYKFQSNGNGDPEITISCNEGEFSFDDNNGYDFSGIVYLEAGEEVSCYLYNNDGDDCVFTITKNKDVTNISFSLIEPIEIIENAGGYFEEWYNPETEEWETKYFYEGYNICKEGNTLTVNYDDGTSIDYIYSWNDEQYEWVWSDSDGNEIATPRCYDYQSKTPWSKDGENYIVVEYMKQTTQVPVSIIENPVESIEFTVSEPYVYIENVGGYFEEWYNPDTEEWEMKYFYEGYDINEEGNTLTVNYNDGTSVNYSYMWNSECRDFTWCDSEGDAIDYSLRCYDYQCETPWTIGQENYIIVEYLDHKAQVPVSIIENPVESVEFQTPYQIEIIEETNGYWTDESVWNNETGEYDFLDYYYYYHSRYIDKAGNAITIYFKDGTKDIYAYDGWNFRNSLGELLDVSYSTNQSYNNRWTVGGDNYITLKIIDYDFEVQVPVTIVEDKYEAIEFVPVEALVLEQYTGGAWSSYYDSEAGEKKSCYYYYIDNLVCKDGNIINLIQNDGTKQSYVYSEKADGFYNEKNQELSIETSDNPRDWSIGGENIFTISAVGQYCQVNVTLIEGSDVVSDGDYVAEKISDDSCIITEINGYESTITIPETIDGYNVVGIEDGVLGEFYSLYELNLPSTFSIVSENLFENCNRLRAVNVSEDNAIFASINGVLYNKSLTEIIYCPPCLSGTLVIKADVTELPESAIAHLGSGASVEIEDGNTSFVNEDGVLYNSTFTKIYKAYSVGAEHVMKSTVTEVAQQAFSGLVDLESITFSAGVTEISYATFYGCSSLTNIDLPESLVSIGTRAFFGCSSLAQVEFNDSLEVIEDGAFWGSGLTKVVLTNNITDIVGAFSNCDSLIDATIPDSVMYMDYAFYGCESLESVIVGKGVKSMQNAFSVCPSLALVQLADGVNCDSSYAFAWCKNLEEITIPSTVTELSYRQFLGCESLNTIDIPATLYNVGWGSLDDTAWYEAQPNGVTYLEHVLYSYKGAMPADSVITVKSGTTAIAESAFVDRFKLAEVILPDGLKYIGDNAFDGCLSLKSITIPGSVDYIGKYSLGYDYNNGWVQNIYKYEDFTIYGVKGSVAEEYANENGFTFIEVAEEHTCIPGDWIYDQEPTCTVYGKRHNECTICGEVLTTQTLNPLGHSYGEWIIDEEPFCFRGGSQSKTCSVCGDVVTEVIEKLPHNYSDEWTVDVEPTVESEGEKSRHCLNCNAKTDITAIPRISVTDIAYVETTGILCNGEITYIVKLKEGVKVTGAVFGAIYDPDVLEAIDAKSGACTSINSSGDEILNINGVYVAGMKCDSDNTYVVGHVNMVDYTCSTDTAYMQFTFKVKDFTIANTVVNFYCVEFNGTPNVSKNDYKIIVSQLSEEIYSYDHTPCSEWKIEKEANAVEAGSRYKDCTVCGEVLETEMMPQTVCDKPVITGIEASENGLVLSWSSTYGADSYRIYRKTNSNWNLIAECASTVTSYIDTAVSKNIEYSYAIKAINEVGDSELSNVVIKAYHVHSLGEWLVRIAPTCTEYGESYRICSGCDYEEMEITEPIGHKYSTDWTVDVEPTCIEDGSKSHHCTVCGDKADITAISAIGHSYSTEWTIDVEATCTEKGSKSHHCTACGDKADVTVIETIGHNYVKVSISSEHPHTTTYVCSYCGAEKNATTTVSGCVECNFTITPIDSDSYKLVSFIGTGPDVVIPATYNDLAITTIANSCFRGNTSITSVKIANGVISIGSLAFMNCTSLEKVYIPASVTSIGAQAFYGFTGTVYCFSGSTAHEYAVANSIDFVLINIIEKENTQIDYEKFIIRTSVQNCQDIADIIGVSETTMAIATASYIYGNLELYGTGTLITIFDGNDYIGDFTLIVDGDVTGDSIVDVLDAMQIALVSNGHKTLDGSYAMAADSNEDDIVDITDYQAIVNKVVA